MTARRFLAGLLLLTLGAAAASGSAAPRTIAVSRVVDLSHPISAAIPLWPGDPRIRFEVVATRKKDGYFLRSVTIGEHSATHMNAASSFLSGPGRSITSYAPATRVVPAVVIDIRSKAAADADYQLTRQDVLAWETRHGRIAPGSLVILFTGWQEKWRHPAAFLGLDAHGRLHFPGFAGATTAWLLADRQIAGVGTDTHGVDPGLDTTYATNSLIARAHKIAVECLANLDRLPATGATLVLAPLQLEGGSGSPLDVLAFVP